MDVLDLDRWQFAITTVHHFLFVPITMGRSGLVAVCETMRCVRRTSCTSTSIPVRCPSAMPRATASVLPDIDS